MEKLNGLLETYGIGLRKWSSKKFKSIPKTIKDKSEKLKTLQPREEHSIMGEINLLHQVLTILIEQENTKWKQQAKRNWFKDGDRNIKNLHACASQHRKKNNIISISNEENQVFTKAKDIPKTF